MTALTIVQNACLRLGLTSPQSVFASTNVQTLQMAGLMNQAGYVNMHDWQWRQLTTEQTFVTVAAELQPGAVPSDCDRIIPDTVYNRSTTRKVYGPLSEEDWQKYKAYPIFTSVNPAFILRGDTDWYFQPAPSASWTIAYSYITKNWAKDASLVGISSMSADTDTSKFPDELMTLEVIWRFLKAKNFDYAEALNDCESYRAQLMAQNKCAPRLNMTFGLNRFSIYPANVPEGNYPAPSP